MIKQLLNSVIAKYRDLSVSRRSIICLSLRLRQIIDLLATDKSWYFAQPCWIINYCIDRASKNKLSRIIIRSKFFFLFNGWEPTTWPANNCLQIMVCSCAMPSNCVWLQIIFYSCVKETMLFSFLRSLLRENGRSWLRFPRIFIKKTNSVIEW